MENTSCHKNPMTANVITLKRERVTSLTTYVSIMHFLDVQLFILKAVKSHFQGLYDQHTVSVLPPSLKQYELTWSEGPQGTIAKRLLRRALCVLRRPSTLENKYSNIFCYKTAGPTVLKFHVEHDLTPGSQNCKIGSARMSKMAAVIKDSKK